MVWPSAHHKCFGQRASGVPTPSREAILRDPCGPTRGLQRECCTDLMCSRLGEVGVRRFSEHFQEREGTLPRGDRPLLCLHLKLEGEKLN